MRDNISLLREKIKSETVLKNFDNIEFLMSGTSAIEFAVQDALKKNPLLKDVYLPTYRCECIDMTFLDNNCLIHDYEIGYDDKKRRLFAKLPDIENAIIFLCDFFVHTSEYYDFIESAKDRNVIVIYDITHTLFCDNLSLDKCDYVVASLRKWFRTADGGVVFGQSAFNIKTKRTNQRFVTYKRLDLWLGRKKRGKLTTRLQNYFSKKSAKEWEVNYKQREISSRTAKYISGLDIEKTLEKRRNNIKLMVKLLNQESLAGLVENALFSYPYITSDSNIEEKIDELRNAGVRCTRFWNETDFVFENNISIDVNRDFSSKQLKCVKGVINNKGKTILHLSDLHFSDDDFEGNFERVYNEFESQISKENLDVDYLFLTGDMITFYSLKYGYKCLKIFLDRTKKLLSLTNDEIFYITGNHENISKNKCARNNRLFNRFIKDNCNKKCLMSVFDENIEGHNFVFYNSYIKNTQDGWSMEVDRKLGVHTCEICVIHGNPRHYTNKNFNPQNVICGHKLKELNCEEMNDMTKGFVVTISSLDGFCSGDYVVGVYNINRNNPVMHAKQLHFKHE